jgi:hypothetical protein
MEFTETFLLPEERRAARIFVRMPVTLLVENESKNTEHGSVAIDLSELGARIRTSAPLSPGQNLVMMSSDGARQSLPSRVVWVKATTPEEVTEAGLEFLHPLTVAFLIGKLMIYKATDAGAEFEVRFIPYAWRRNKATPTKPIASLEELISFLKKLAIAQQALERALSDIGKPHNLDAVIQNVCVGYHDLRNQNLLP